MSSDGWGASIHPGSCVVSYPIRSSESLLIRMVRFRVETIPLVERFGLDEEKVFLNSVVEYFRVNRASMIIPATTNTIFRTYPDGAIAAPYGSYIIDLTRDEQTLFAQLNSSHRRKVRLAMKQGVQILNGIQYLKIAYNLVRDTFKRSALPFMGFDAFKRYIASLGENIKILVADYKGVVQGCLVVPFSTYCAYYVYGGSIPEPATGAMNLLHWEAIRQFRGSGVRRYDFVGVRVNPERGSKQEGLKMFKERFGGQLMQGYMWKIALTSWKYMIYSQAIRRFRGGDIVDHEHIKLEIVERVHVINNIGVK